jgi:hypothetical protein
MDISQPAAWTMLKEEKKSPDKSGLFFSTTWRREPESNRPKRLCRPLHNRFAIAPKADYETVATSLLTADLHNRFADLFDDRRTGSPNKKGSVASPLCLERETRLELATSTLARLRSTN